MKILKFAAYVLALLILASFLRDQFGQEPWFGRYSRDWLFETYCLPHAWCVWPLAALTILGLGAALVTMHRNTRSKSLRVLDFVAVAVGGFFLLAFLLSRLTGGT